MKIVQQDLLQFLKILWSEVRKGGFQFLWKMVLWGATFNAVVAVGVVSLLLFRLPLAILWKVNEKERTHLLQNVVKKCINLLPQEISKEIFFLVASFVRKSLRIDMVEMLSDLNIASPFLWCNHIKRWDGIWGVGLLYGWTDNTRKSLNLGRALKFLGFLTKNNSQYIRWSTKVRSF